MTNRPSMPRVADVEVGDRADSELIPVSAPLEKYTSRQFAQDLVTSYDEATRDMSDREKIMFEAEYWPFIAQCTSMMQHRLNTKAAQKQLSQALGIIVNDVLQASLRYRAEMAA